MNQMTGPKHFHHTTINQQYHALYADDVMVRIDAWYAEQERQMRECMSDADNYDLDGIRAVVAYWRDCCPNGNAHRVALEVLAERKSEEKAQRVAQPQLKPFAAVGQRRIEGNVCSEFLCWANDGDVLVTTLPLGYNIRSNV